MMNKQLQSKNQAIRKLDRRNAIKNIDYHATSSTSPSSVDDDVTIPSFRVEGIDGDIDLICRSLGLSGPEDFAIPTAAWEALKSSSSIDWSSQGLHNRKLRSCELGINQNSEKIRNGDAKVRGKDKERTENGFNNRNLRSCELGIHRNSENFRGNHSKRDDLFDTIEAKVRVNETNENLFNLRETGARVRDGNETKCELSNNRSLEKFKVIDSKRGNSSDTLETKFRVRESNRNDNGFTAGEIGVRVRDCDDVACELINHGNSEKIEVIDCRRDTQSETLGRNFRVRESKGNENVVEAKIEVMVKRTEELRNPISVRSFRSGINGARPPVLAPPPVISPTQQTDNMSSSWDLLRSFGPPSDEDSGSCITSLQDKKATSGNTEGVERRKLDVDREWLGDNKVISEFCLNTSENKDDDDAINVMVEHLHYVSPLGKFKCTINSWQKGDFLGSGSFGTVYEGFTDDGIFFAVKEVSLLDQGDQGKQSIYQLEQEIFFLSQFEHENIVQYLGTDKDNGKLYIFLELVTKGSLASLYQKYNLQDSQVSAYTRQILNGLNYLHLRKVVHRDIKCANILVDASGSVKLADFGLAKATNLNDVKSCKGTAFWMAPEVVNRKKHGYGLAADIWSLGCTVLEMLTRRIPYSHLEGMQALFRIGKGEPPPIPNSLSSEARDFISKCLQVDPDHRPTAAQLLDHPFVKRPLATFSAPASPFHHGRRL